MNATISHTAVTRRRLSFGLAACATACVAAWPLTGSARSEPVRRGARRALMGTVVEIAAQGPEARVLEQAIDASFGRMATLAAQMSHYADSSQVAQIGAAAGRHAVPVSVDLMRVLAMSQRVSARSDGAFDATIGSVGLWDFNPGTPRMPSADHIRTHIGCVDYRQVQLDTDRGTAFLHRAGARLDLGGIAKLYILEAGLQTLQALGIGTAMVNGGGDVVAITDTGARPWRIGIRDPRQPARLLGAVDLSCGFVASSGDYERFFVRDGHRYHHVLDPRTGYPTEGPHGVTLVGDTLDSVNGLGAAAMVLAPPAAQDLLTREGPDQALVAGHDGRIWLTPALRRRLQSV